MTGPPAFTIDDLNPTPITGRVVSSDYFAVIAGALATKVAALIFIDAFLPPASGRRQPLRRS